MLFKYKENIQNLLDKLQTEHDPKAQVAEFVEQVNEVSKAMFGVEIE